MSLLLVTVITYQLSTAGVSNQSQVFYLVNHVTWSLYIDIDMGSSVAGKCRW